MKRRIKWFWWSLTNWLGGYKFAPVKRCRTCDHTVYPSDRLGKFCRHCAVIPSA